jgi:hypothetical protein
MTEGFGKEKSSIKAVLNDRELNRLIKEYKKIKKYKKSSIYTVKTMDGDEKIISTLLEKFGDEG